MLKAFAGGFNFAHLIGLSPSSKSSAPSEDLRDQPAPEAAAAAPAQAETDECEDEDMEDKAAAGADGKGGKKSGKKKAEEEDEDETSEGEQDGDDDEDEDEDEEASSEGKGKGKQAAAPAAPKASAKAAAKSGSEFKRGRKAERRRIGLILSNKAAAANLPFACKLACNTGMSSSAAIALLEQTPAARGGRLDRQMKDAGIPEVKAGAPEGPKGEAAIASSWDTAMQSVVPKK